MKETAMGPTISPKTGEPLCPEWAKRAAIPEGEFWDYVFNRHQGEDDLSWLPGYEPWSPLWEAVEQIGTANPCPVCGSITTCGYDDEGRAFVHCVEVDRA